MTAKEQNRLAGIFLLAHGSLQIIGLIFAFVAWVIMGTAFTAYSTKQEEKFVGLFLFGIIVFIGIISIVLITPQIVGGWKLLKEKPNARTWGIAGSICSCLNFPLGTAAGVYGLWFLFGDIGKNYYLANNMNQNMFENPPPPQNWT